MRKELDQYTTLKGRSESLYKEKGSKFFGYAFPVKELETVDRELDSIRAMHPKCRHICYAYLIEGDQQQIERVNDAGEPSGSAGFPILGQIRSKDLVNTMVVVARYFGGTKLGTSRLKSAFKETARLALENGKGIQCFVSSLFALYFDYSVLSEMMQLLNRMDLQIIDQKYDKTCILKVSIRRKESEKLQSICTKISNLEIKFIKDF